MRTTLIWQRAMAAVGSLLIAASCAGPVAPVAPSGSSGVTASGAPSTVPQANAPWPAPSDPMERAVAAGLIPGPKEFMVNHVHAHLDVFIDGTEIQVPSGIGINTADPAVRRFDEPDGTVGYGGIELCAQPCISPLHTHAAGGIIHTESSDPTPHTLGQFFTAWGVELSPTCVGEHCAPTPIAVYIAGERFEGDPRTIELTDQKVIVIVVGTPPAEIPSTADFSKP